MLLSCIVALLLSLSLGSLVKLEITLQTLVPKNKHSELQVLFTAMIVVTLLEGDQL
jgi:hypothetical protein